MIWHLDNLTSLHFCILNRKCKDWKSNKWLLTNNDKQDFWFNVLGPAIWTNCFAFLRYFSKYYWPLRSWSAVGNQQTKRMTKKRVVNHHWWWKNYNKEKRENSRNSFLLNTLTTNQQIIIINSFKRQEGRWQKIRIRKKKDKRYHRVSDLGWSCWLRQSLFCVCLNKQELETKRCYWVTPILFARKCTTATTLPENNPRLETKDKGILGNKY